MGVFFKECFLQKTNQFDALKVWDELGIGVDLFLTSDGKGNIIARTKDTDMVTIGVLSIEDALSLKPYFDAGWNSVPVPDKTLYSSIISRFDEKADENKRISIAIYIEACKGR